jgi:Tfp pilus assembly protein PilO
MKYFFKKYKIHLAIAIYLLIIGAASFFIARPMILGIREKNDEIQKNIADQESKKERLGKLPAFKKQFEEIGANEDKINIVLNNGNIVVLIEKLEKISEETGNKIKIDMAGDQTNKKTQSSSKKDDKSLANNLPSDSYIIMNITLTGNYENFLDFIRKIENMEYYSDILSIKITKGINDNSSSATSPFIGSDSSGASTGGKDSISSVLGVAFYLEKK